MEQYTREEIIKANSQIYDNLVARKALLEKTFGTNQPEQIQNEISSIVAELSSLRRAIDDKGELIKGEKTGVITVKYSSSTSTPYTPDSAIERLSEMTKENDALIQQMQLNGQMEQANVQYNDPDKIFNDFKAEMNAAQNSDQMHQIQGKYADMFYNGTKLETMESRKQEFDEIYKASQQNFDKMVEREVQYKQQNEQMVDRIAQANMQAMYQKFYQDKQRYEQASRFKKLIARITGKAYKVDGEYVMEEDKQGMSK